MQPAKSVQTPLSPDEAEVVQGIQKMFRRALAREGKASVDECELMTVSLGRYEKNTGGSSCWRLTIRMDDPDGQGKSVTEAVARMLQYDGDRRSRPGTAIFDMVFDLKAGTALKDCIQQMADGLAQKYREQKPDRSAPDAVSRDRVLRAIQLLGQGFADTLGKKLVSAGAKKLELYGLTVKFDPVERRNSVTGQDMLPLCRISVYFLLPGTARLSRSFDLKTWTEREMDPQSRGLRQQCFQHDLDLVEVDSRSPGARAYIENLFRDIVRSFANLPAPQPPLPELPQPGPKPKKAEIIHFGP